MWRTGSLTHTGMGFLGMAQVGVGTEASLEVLGGQPRSLSTGVGSWWSGVEHLGALLLVNAKASGTPASLELQQRASVPRAPGEVALTPIKRAWLLTHPPSDSWMGKKRGVVSEPGRIGKELQCAGLRQSRRQEGA